jgi:lipopolysaccharide export system permease protein
MITLIDRLLFREVVKALGLIVGVLVVILLSNNLVRILGKVAAGGLGQDVVFALVGLELLKIVGFMIPPAFFFAILWVLGRMHRDSEMVALEASGVGTLRIYRAFFLVAIPLAALVLWLVMDVLPWAKSQSVAIRAEQRAAGEIIGLRPGQFNEFKRGGLVVFADKLSIDAGFEGLFVQQRDGERVVVVSAARASVEDDPRTGERYIILADGRRYEGVPGDADYALGRFAAYGLRIPSADPAAGSSQTSAKSWQTLWNSQAPKDRAELHYRIAFPLAVLAFVLVSVPLARSLPRQGVYGKLVLAVVVYFVFMNLLRLAQHWLENEQAPFWLGVWWVPALMAGLAGALLFFDSIWFAVRWRRWRGGAR